MLKVLYSGPTAIYSTTSRNSTQSKHSSTVRDSKALSRRRGKRTLTVTTCQLPAAICLQLKELCTYVNKHVMYTNPSKQKR